MLFGRLSRADAQFFSGLLTSLLFGSAYEKVLCQAKKREDLSVWEAESPVRCIADRDQFESSEKLTYEGKEYATCPF